MKSVSEIFGQHSFTHSSLIRSYTLARIPALNFGSMTEAPTVSWLPITRAGGEPFFTKTGQALTTRPPPSPLHWMQA